MPLTTCIPRRRSGTVRAGERLGERARVAVVLGQPAAVVLDRVEAGRREHASHPLKVGDVISVNEKSKTHAQIIDALTHSGSVVVPEYYEVNKVKMEGKLVAKPLRDQIPVKLQEQHVVEYYSR
jgi:hypothetical protein